MCEPVSIATAAISIAGTVAAASAKQSEANASARFQGKRYTDTATQALDSYRRTLGQLSLRDSQEAVAATQQANTNASQGRQVRGRAAALAAAAGVSGTSVNAALTEFDTINWENDFNIWRNRQWQSAQIRENMAGARAQAQGQISGVTPSPVYGPSGLATGLGVASGALSGVNTYMDVTGKDLWGRPLRT